MNHATERIGQTYPQHQDMVSGYDYNAPDSVHKLSFDSFPDFEPNFNTVVIHGHAKLTDLLSTSPIVCSGYLVSSRLRAVLEKFEIQNHRYYSVPATYRGKQIKDYFWLQLPQPDLTLTENASVEEFEHAVSLSPTLASLHLLQFHRPVRFSYCFLSSPLRSAMMAAGITGVRYGTAKVFRSAP